MKINEKFNNCNKVLNVKSYLSDGLLKFVKKHMNKLACTYFPSKNINVVDCLVLETFNAC